MSLSLSLLHTPLPSDSHSCTPVPWTLHSCYCLPLYHGGGGDGSDDGIGEGGELLAAFATERCLL